jgi:hypothetical protein
MKNNELKLWKSYQTNLNENEIQNYISIELKKIIDWYCSYYNKEDVISKFRNKKNSIILINNIKNIKVVSYFKPSGNTTDRSWGYIYTNNLFTVFLNVYNFFNGRISASISDTIIHEIGHLIDFQLRSLNEVSSHFEPSVLNNLPKDEYIVSREEDYARIQRLRMLLNLSPLADINELGKNLNILINNKSIILESFNLEYIENKLIVSIPNQQIRILSLSELSSVFGSIVINGYLSSDIGYLFAKYSKVVNSRIEVDLDKIVKINKLFVDTSSDFGNFG